MTRNAALLLAARLVSAGTTVLLLVYIGHAEGGVALGIAGVGLAMGALLSAISDAGTASLMIREGARDPSSLGRLVVAMSVWRLAVTPLAAVMLWLVIVSTIAIRPGAVFLLAVGLAVQAFADLTRGVFVARQQMHVSSLHGTVENLCWLVAIVASLAAGASLEVAFAAGLAVFCLSTVAGFILIALSGTGPFGFPDTTMLRSLVGKLGPFAAFMVVGVGYSRIDTLLIGALLPTNALAAAGAYFAAVRLLAGMEYIPEAVARAGYPRLARAFQVGRDEVATEVRPLATFLVVAGIPIPLFMAVAGPWLMTTLFGPDVAPFAWVVIPLSLVMPLRFLSHLFGTALTSTDEQGRRVIAVLGALMLVLVIDIALIRVMGVGGAVAGSLVASAWIFAMYARPLIRHAGGMGLGTAALRSLAVVAALSLAAVFLLPMVGPSATLGVIVVAYAAGMVGLGRLRAAAPLRQQS